MWRRMISEGIVLAGAVTMLGCFVFGCFAFTAEPLKIGMVAPLTGPGAESGLYQIQGTKLAVEEVNKAGGVLGRQIELLIEDDQTTDPGVVVAFRKLAGHEDIPAFMGPIRSIQVHAIARDIQKLGKPVMIGGTDPQLTHMGNPWLFRFRPNDIYSARVIADYGLNTLGKKRWAIVYSLDAFGTSGMKNLVELLKKMGVEPDLVQGYTNNWQDSTPVAVAVKQSGDDIMGTYMTFEPDLGVFAKQLMQVGVHITWVGSPSTVATTALKLAGPALYGSYAVVDFNRDSSPAAKEFAAKYEAAYRSAPDFFASWAYDAVHVLALAINKAQSLDAKKIREAILSEKGYEGAEGTYNFDQNGDGLHGYNIVRNDNGMIVFEKHIDFNDWSTAVPARMVSVRIAPAQMQRRRKPGSKVAAPQAKPLSQRDYSPRHNHVAHPRGSLPTEPQGDDAPLIITALIAMPWPPPTGPQGGTFGRLRQSASLGENGTERKTATGH